MGPIKKVCTVSAAALAAVALSVGMAFPAQAATTAPTSSDTISASSDTAASAKDTAAVAASPDPAAIPSAAATQAAAPVATKEAAAPVATQAAAPAVKADPTTAATDNAVSTSTNTKAPAPTPSAPAKDTKPVTSGSPSKGNNDGGYTNPYDKACIPGDPSALSWTRNADLSTATVTLKSPYTSCNVTLQSFETEGPTWETSGTQKFVDYDGTTLTKKAPTVTLTVTTKGCFTQQDLASGSPTKNNGIEAPLPHYPNSNTPSGLLNSYNGGAPCAPPVAAAGGTATGSQSVCTPDYKATPNLLTITSAEGSSAVVKQGTGEGIFKGADDGTFDVSKLVGDDAYPVTFQVEFVGKGGDYTKPIDVTFDQPKSSADCAQPVVILPTAETQVSCGLVTATYNAGSSDTTFDLVVNGKVVSTVPVKAGQSFEDSYALIEDSTGGSATAVVQIAGVDVTDVKTVSTDCITNIVTITPPAAPKAPEATCTPLTGLPNLATGEGFTGKWDRSFNGAGTYTATYVAAEGVVFTNDVTVVTYKYVVPAAKDCTTTTKDNPQKGTTVVATNNTPTPPSALAFTGSNPLLPLEVAGGLLALGAILMIARRRRIISTEVE